MDRRTIYAILLMMVIAILPAIFIKRPPPAATPATGDTTAAPVAPTPAGPAPAVGPADTARSAAAEVRATPSSSET